MSAKDDYSAARKRFEQARSQYERLYEQFNAELKHLGELKVEGMRVRAEVADVLRDLPPDELDDLDGSFAISAATLHRWQADYSMVAGLVGSTAAGTVTAMVGAAGAYTLIGAIGTASTGAAIAGLSGAAAHSATMAALGGGAVAAGGFGMVGGAIALTGIGAVVGIPVAVGGIWWMHTRRYRKAAKMLGDCTQELTRRNSTLTEKLSDVKQLQEDISSLTKNISTLLFEYKQMTQSFISNLMSLGFRRYKARRLRSQLREAVLELTDLIEKPILTEEEYTWLQTEPCAEA